MSELDILSAKIDSARAVLEDQQPTTYPLITAAELAAEPTQPWLVDQVVPLEGLGIIVGRTGDGKTFLLLDLGAAVAEGQPWFDYDVEQGPVVILGLEGRAGFKQRIVAWEQDRGRAFPGEVWFGFEEFSILDPDRIEALCDSIEAKGGAQLLMIDTLNRASTGSDENSSIDMGRVLLGAARLQKRLACTVVLVHHLGKDATRGPRGHSSLLAAADFAIGVERQADIAQWHMLKAKDAADGAIHTFELKVVQLPPAQSGELTTSCVIRPVQLPGIARAPRLPKGQNQRIVLSELATLLQLGSGDGEAGVDFEQAVQRIKERLPVDKERQHERTVDALRSLVRHGFVRQRGQRVLPAGNEEAPSTFMEFAPENEGGETEEEAPCD